MQAATPQTLIVCGGGGLQGAFIGGAMAQIIQDFPAEARQVDHIFATSASVGSIFYYLSHVSQHNGKSIWTDQIPNSSFLNFTSTASLFGLNPVYDIAHLVQVVFQQNNPLNLNQIQQNTIHFAFPILNLNTKELEIFSNKPEQAKAFFPSHIIRDWRNYDIYNLIHAACAIPILYDRPVKLGEDTYCDPGIATPFLVPEAVPENLNALYLIVRQRTVWSHDWKLVLAGFIWRLRAARGKTGLPGWVYTHITQKPLTLRKLAQHLKATMPNAIKVSATTPLMSSLQNTPESALHNWQTGENHIKAISPQLTKFFRKT